MGRKVCMRRVKNTITRYNLIRGWRRLAAVIGLIGVLLLGLVGFDDTEVHAASNYSPLTCHTQGATVTKKYFLYTDWCGDGNATKIYRCDRAGTSISNCRKIVEGKFLHANVLYHVWDSNYFWIFDSGSPRKSGNAWCYNLNGKKAADEKCGTIPYNHGPQIDASRYTYLQGFTKYGNYHLKGVSGPNQIAVLRDVKLEKVLTVGYNIEELEDVSVDGDTGEIYFTTNGGGAVKLYKYSGYKLPPVPTTLNKTVKSGKTKVTKTTVTKPVAVKSDSEKSDAAKNTSEKSAKAKDAEKSDTAKSTTRDVKVNSEAKSEKPSAETKGTETKAEGTKTESAKTEVKTDKPATTDTQVKQPVAAETQVSQPVAAETGTSQSATTETRASQPVAVTENRPTTEGRPVAETPSSQVAVEEPSNQTSEEQNSQQPSSQPSQQTETVTENETEARGGIKTTFFGEIEDDDKGCGIYRVLDLVIDILSVGIGIAAVVGISLSGITYMTAVGNPQKTTTAKRRIAEIVIGVALYALLYAVLNFLLPGGKLNPSDVCLAIG